MSDANWVKKTVDDAYDVLLKKGDLDGFLSYFDEESEMIEAASLPYGGVYRGKTAIKEGILKVFGYWKDFGFAVETTVCNADYAIAYGRFSATSIKTGKKVSFPLAEVWKFKGERVVFIQPIYSDTKEALDALG